MNTMKKCSTCGNLYSGDLCAKCMAGFAQKSSEPTAPPEDLPLKPGQTFHGLEIIELLGKGGMGVVYKARQPALDRLVALKILPQKMALDPDFQNRFIREAKALGSLSHPNIVAVYDFGADSGLFFFAMEYVDGTNLRQVLRDRKLTPEQALKIVPQLCDALEIAHTEGVVHRDIKPENILLDKKGRVKIADFGLAKLVGADVAAANMLTVTNMVMGTPHYMAPEQVENPKSVDHRADIYAIGVVFYEMLTGELPIGRFELPSKKVQVDVRLDDVVLKALEKSPERRYQNASDVKEAVTKATAVTSTVDSYSPTVITPRPAEKKGKLPVVAGLAALAIVAVVAICWIALSGSRHPKPPVVVKDPDPKVPVTPVAAGPVDLTPIYFGPNDRPGGYVYQKPGEGLPRNPMPIKDPGEIDILIKNLDGIGLQNVGRGDVKQGYVAAWFRWETAFIAMETPVAERLEQEFLALKFDNKWTHRKGELLVLAWARRSDARSIFVHLVSMIQKKLGLPAEAPDVPLENISLDRSWLQEGWVLEPLQPPVLGKRTGMSAGSEYSIVHPELKGAILAIAASFDTPARAKAEEAEILKSLKKDATKTESYVVGRTLLALALRGRQVGAYEKLAAKLRTAMGFPDHTFDTILPMEAELPEGYRFDSVETDVRAILKAIPLTGVQPGEISRAWRALLKPHGSIVLLQTVDSSSHSGIREQLSKRGAGWDGNGISWGVEAPDDEALDAIENFVREKFGWDRNSPRPLQLQSARLQPADLPAGFELADEAIDARTFTCTLKSADCSLACKIQQTFDYGVVEKLHKELPSKPGDVVLMKDTVLAWVSGPPSAWKTLDALEATLRRKMRLGPPTVSDIALRKADLPQGSLYLNRAPVLTPNPRLSKSSSTEVKGWWEAIVDPSETKIDVYELRDEETATAWVTLLEEKRKKQSPASVHFRILRRGPFVAALEQKKPGEAVFNTLVDALRGKLRIAQP